MPKFHSNNNRVLATVVRYAGLKLYHRASPAPEYYHKDRTADPRGFSTSHPGAPVEKPALVILCGCNWTYATGTGYSTDYKSHPKLADRENRQTVAGISTPYELSERAIFHLPNRSFILVDTTPPYRHYRHQHNPHPHSLTTPDSIARNQYGKMAIISVLRKIQGTLVKLVRIDEVFFINISTNEQTKERRKERKDRRKAK